LRDFEESPVLPTGYAGMIVLAIVPAVWRRVMDPRVLAHVGGDITRTNISPRRRDRLLAAYPPPTGRPQRHTDGAIDDTERMTSRVAAADEALTWTCPGCQYTYDVVAGEEREGFAAGTAWSEIPDSWCCPDCGVRDKVDFVPADPVVAS
jgi:alkane 1-monooxygenase